MKIQRKLALFVLAFVASTQEAKAQDNSTEPSEGEDDAPVITCETPITTCDCFADSCPEDAWLISGDTISDADECQAWCDEACGQTGSGHSFTCDPPPNEKWDTVTVCTKEGSCTCQSDNNCETLPTAFTTKECELKCQESCGEGAGFSFSCNSEDTLPPASDALRGTKTDTSDTSAKVIAIALALVAPMVL